MNFHMQCTTINEQYWRTDNSSQPANHHHRDLAIPPILHDTNQNQNSTNHPYSNVSSYTYPSSEPFLAYNNNAVETSTSSHISPISNSDFSPYSAIEQYEETSSAYAEEGLSRYPPQFADYSDYSHVSFQNDSHSNSPELVHSYRRIPIADDMDYMNAPSSSSSQKKRPTGQLTATRQQLTAKFECVACHARFSYESSAKRHQLNQIKRFRCSVCNQKFARVDYRNWHQRRCETGFRLSDVEKPPG